MNQEATLYLQADTQYYSLGSSGDHCTLTGYSTALASDAASGASSIVVDSSTGMTATDYIGIELDSGSLQWTTVGVITGSPTITLDATLTGAASEGNVVYYYTTKVDRPLGILEARSVSGGELVMNRLSRDGYMSKPDKSTTGQPVEYFFDPQLTNARMYIWPVADVVDTTIKMTLKTPVQDFDAAANSPHFPVEWIRPLVYNLAIDLAPSYERPITPSLQFLATSSLAAVREHDADHGPLRIFLRDR